MKSAKPFLEQRRERRGLLRAGLGLAAGGMLGGCDALSHNDAAVEILRSAEGLNNSVHRVLGRRAMAQEFAASEIAPVFRANGTTMPPGEDYAALVSSGFAGWTLTVDGLVDKPLELTMAAPLP